MPMLRQADCELRESHLNVSSPEALCQGGSFFCGCHRGCFLRILSFEFCYCVLWQVAQLSLVSYLIDVR